jgi:hypothetical protein
VKTNSLPRYANKEEIDLAYQVAYRCLDLVEALHRGPTLAMDLDSSYSMLSDFVLDFVMQAQALKEVKESLDLQFEVISKNRRFAHAVILPFFDEGKETIQSEFDVMVGEVRDWCRELLYRIQNWKRPFDHNAMTEAINGIPGQSFGIEFVGDPYQDSEKWPQLFLDATLFEDKFDPRLRALLVEMEADVANCFRKMNGENTYEVFYLRRRCELEHSQLLRDLPSLPAEEAAPSGTRKGIGGRPPKETRGKKTDPQKEQKKKDLLYLRSEYQKWQERQRASTPRRKFNPRDWFDDFDRWTKKARDLFDQYSNEYEDSCSDAEKLEKLLDLARK